MVKCEQSSLTSKLLLPVTGDLAALGLDGLLAVGAGARSLPGAESTVAFIGYAHAPLPLAAVRLALLLSCKTKYASVSFSVTCLQKQTASQHAWKFVLFLQIIKFIEDFSLKPVKTFWFFIKFFTVKV